MVERKFSNKAGKLADYQKIAVIALYLQKDSKKDGKEIAEMLRC